MLTHAKTRVFIYFNKGLAGPAGVDGNAGDGGSAVSY